MNNNQDYPVDNTILLYTRYDYSFNIYKNISILSKDVQKSFLKGCIFRDCYLENVNFDQSDLDGTHIEKSILKDTSFIDADIRSSIFSKSKFIDCIFDSAFINGAYFNECEFVGCSFQRALVSDNKIYNSVYNRNIYINCTQVLNQYNHSKFVDEQLCDCSFYQIIFLKCKFDNVTINIDSIGQTFGISNSDMNDMKYVLRGELLGDPKFDITDIIEASYKAMNWDLYLAIFKLNTQPTNMYYNLVQIFDIIFNNISENNYIIKDDVLFLNNIIKLLASEDRMPLFSVTYGISRLSELAKNYNNKDNYNLLSDALSILLNELVQLADVMLENLLSYQNNTFDPMQNVILKIKTQEKLPISADKIINNILNDYDENNCPKAILLGYEKGSIIEIVATTVSCVFLFQLFLFGINGCLIQLTETKERTKVLLGKKKTSTYSKVARTTNQAIPVYLQPILANIFDKILNKKLLDSICSISSEKIIEAQIEESS